MAYIWTSGRLCNFKGCDRDDLQPVNVNGWFWSGSGVKMAPTNSTPPGWSYQPWSDTGHKTQFNNGVKVAQPDNAEFEINGSVEACMVTILHRNSQFPLEIPISHREFPFPTGNSHEHFGSFFSNSWRKTGDFFFRDMTHSSKSIWGLYHFGSSGSNPGFPNIFFVKNLLLVGTHEPNRSNYDFFFCGRQKMQFCFFLTKPLKSACQTSQFDIYISFTSYENQYEC